MSVYIKDMDMPTDCLACRIACDKENYGVIGRPPKCPLAEAAAGDLISRADAIEVVAKEDCCGWIECKADKIYGSLNALPSAEAVQGEWTNEDGKPITDKFSVYCSRCKEWSEYRTNYCGHCGAKMYKGGDDTTGGSL